YELPHEPFVAFDIMRGDIRMPWADRTRRFALGDFVAPRAISTSGPPVSVDAVLEFYRRSGSGHGALDPVEGAVWRVERQGKVDFLAKFVRADKEDGTYLPEVSGGMPVWNWRPD